MTCNLLGGGRDRLELGGFMSSGGLGGAGEKAGSELESPGWDKFGETSVSS